MLLCLCRLRISLGLKPLAADTQPKGPTKEERERKEQEAAAKTEELAERIKQARERRIQQEKLAATKTLGEEDPDVDDVMAWVNKSRTLTKEEQAKKTRAQAKRKAERQKRAAASDDDVDDDDDGDGQGGDLAGMKVAHAVEELDVGESVVLTLEDKGILDDKGNLREDEEAALENIYAVSLIIISFLKVVVERQRHMFC